jgi:hypothetical protein
MIKFFTTPQQEKQEKIKRPIAWALKNSIIFIKSEKGLLVPPIIKAPMCSCLRANSISTISWLKEVDRDTA